MFPQGARNSQLVGCLSSMCEAQGLIPSTTSNRIIIPAFEREVEAVR